MATTFVGTWETTWVGINNELYPGLTLTVTESFRADPSGHILDGMYEQGTGNLAQCMAS